MNNTENHSKLSILHVIIGTSAAESGCVESKTINTEWGKRIFIFGGQNVCVETEQSLKDLTDVGMVILTPAENDLMMEKAFQLSKAVKDRGILSIVAVENNAQELSECTLNTDAILAHADSLLLVSSEKQNFYQEIDRFLSFTKALVDEEGFINLDFSDISDVLKDSGFSYLSSCTPKGKSYEERISKMDFQEIIPEHILSTAKSSLVELVGCTDVGLEEVEGTIEQLQQHIKPDALVVIGAAFDYDLTEEMQITILLSGFNPL